jgi:hypothetical protein
MNDLILPGTDFTPQVSFIIDQGTLEISGISRPEDVADFYETPLQWLIDFEEAVQRSEYKYDLNEILLRFKLSYFNSASSKYMIQILRQVKNLSEAGMKVNIEWFYEEGDEKMMEDGEDLAEAVGLEFSYLEMED